MKRKNNKRILATLLTALLLTLSVSVCFVSVAAEESGGCGSGLTWTYNDASKTLTISGNGIMHDYMYNGGTEAPWREHCYEITKLVLEDGITYIGNRAFLGCTSLTQVSIPDSVTGMGYSVFTDCTSLVSVKFGTGLRMIGEAAFFNCSSLLSVVIPENIEGIDNSAFTGCVALKRAIIGDGVQSIGIAAFSGCNQLTEVSIGKNVSSIGNQAFRGCGLTELVLGESVETIGWEAFAYCDLHEVTIPKSVSIIGENAFMTGSDHHFSDVYYLGTESEWNEIVIGQGNEDLTCANIHFQEPHTHSYTATVTKAATCTETGVRTYTCTCGESYTETIGIDANNHTAPDQNGNCTRCGKHIKDVEKPADQQPTENLNIFQRILKWIRDLFARLFGRA